MKKYLSVILAVLLALARLANPAHAAVQVWNVAVGGSGPYTVGYNLLCSNGTGPTGVAAITAMTVKIFSQSGTLVRTINVTDATKWTNGAHPNTTTDTTGVTWDGTDDSGTPVPVGVYSAQIEITGAAQAAPAMVGGAANIATVTGGNTDGRWAFNGGANLDITSPYHNRMYWPSTASNTGRNGVYLVSPDMSNSLVGASATLSGASDTAGNGYSKAACVLSDGYIAVTDSSATTGGKVTVLTPGVSASNAVAKNVYATYGSGLFTRATAAFGNKDSIDLFYIDEAASTTTFLSGAKNIGYAHYGTAAAAPVAIIPSSSFPSSVRSIAVNRAMNVIWVGGTNATGTVTTLMVKRFTRGTGAINLASSWTLDGTFSVAVPSPVATNNQAAAWVALSPDESILWVSANSATGTSQSAVIGVNPTTGTAISGQSITGANLPQWSETVEPWGCFDGTSYTNGNLIFTLFSGTTGTTAKTWGIISPADSGSTDKTRSPFFDVGTMVNLASGPAIVPTYQGGTFTWTTDMVADSKVEFATDSGFASIVKTAYDPAYVQAHSISVSGLNQATTYYYRVTSAATGLTSATSTSTFTTNALLVSGFAITTTENGATLSWTTSEGANTTVALGIASNTYFKTVADSTMVTNHSVTLGSLKTNTQYYFVARSGSGATGTTDSAFPESTFTAHSSSISNTRIVTTPTSATITFNTDGTPDAPATATLLWGSSTSPSTPVPDSGSGNSHVYVISGLTPGSTYYYTVALSGAYITTRTSPVEAFTTVTAGAASTVTQSTAASVALASTVNLDVPADGAIAALAHQGLPGTPVGSTLPTGVTRFYSGVVAYDGYLYCIGGRDAAYTGTAPNSSKATVYVAPLNADGSVGTWVDNATNYLPSGSERAAINNQCFAYNGYIYVVGGLNASVASVGTVLYSKQDPATGNLVSPTGSGAVWQTTTALPVTIYLGSVTVADGYVLATGGFTTGVSTQAYMNRIRPDGTLGTWYATRSLTETASYHRTLVNNHTVYVVGGQQNPGYQLYNTANIASIQPNRDLTPFWKNTNDPDFTTGVMDNPSTPTDSGRWSMGSGIIRGKILLAAGRLNNGYGATATNIISTGKLAPAGQVNGWVASSNTYPAALMELDGVVYRGSFYGIGGRTTTTSSTASNAVVRIPFVDDTGYAYSGTFESNFIDLTGSNTLTTLRHITVAGTGVTPDSVELRYRYCGIDSASVFSEWQSTDGPDVDITGSARYVQYQLVLKGDGTSTPVVSGVTITSGTTADLSISSLTVDKPVANPGDTVVYTAAVYNNGPDAALGVVLSDNLPAGLTFVSASGGTVGGTPSSPTVTIGAIPAGGTATVTISATVNALAAGQTITNTVSEAYAGTDSSTGNDSASASTTVNAPVTVNSVTVSPATTAVGRQTTITATVTPGTNPVAGVVADLSPIGGSAAQALSNGGSGNTYSFTATVATGVADGAKSINVVATDSIDGLTATGSAILTVQTPVVIHSAAFVPASVWPGGSSTLTVTITPGTNPVAGVTADLSSIGGSATQALSNGGSGNVYSFTASVDPSTSSALKTVSVVATDSVDALTATSSATLDVLGITQIVFGAQPGPAVKGFPLSTQPVVKIEAANGDVASTYNGPVTIVLKDGTGTLGAVLSGATTINAVGGVATFTDLAIDRAGAGYILTATATDPSLSVDSAAFTIRDVPTGPWGDVDQDGFVTLADADLVHTYLTNPDSLTPQQRERIVRYGDVAGTHNETVVGDGAVDMNDILRVARIAGGIIDPGTAGPTYPHYGDVDGDGIVTIQDVLVLARYITGLETDPALVARIQTRGVGDVWPTTQKVVFGDGQITADDEALIRLIATGADLNPPAYPDYWPLIPGDQYTFTDLNHRSGDALGQTTFTTSAPSAPSGYPFDPRGYTVSEVAGNDGSSLAGVYKGINGSVYALYVQFPFFSAERMDFQSPMKILDVTNLTPGASWSGDLVSQVSSFGLRPVHYKVTVLSVGGKYTNAAGNYPTVPSGVFSTWSDTVSIRIDIAVLAGVNSPIEMQQAIFFDFAPGIGPVARGQAPIQGAAAPATDRPLLELDAATVRGITYDQTHPTP